MSIYNINIVATNDNGFAIPAEVFLNSISQGTITPPASLSVAITGGTTYLLEVVPTDPNYPTYTVTFEAPLNLIQSQQQPVTLDIVFVEQSPGSPQTEVYCNFFIFYYPCSSKICALYTVSGIVTTVTWYWGDGTSSTGLTSCHNYTSAGDYEVSMVAELCSSSPLTGTSNPCDSEVPNVPVDDSFILMDNLTITDGGSSTCANTPILTIVTPDPIPTGVTIAANFVAGTSPGTGAIEIAYTYNGSSYLPSNVIPISVLVSEFCTLPDIIEFEINGEIVL